MATWTHPVCYPCWQQKFQIAPQQEPLRVLGDELKRCCFCGYMTDSGIFVRHDPQRLTCDHE
jgi:hypothetical protein